MDTKYLKNFTVIL